MVVPRSTRLQFLVVRLSFWLSVYLEQGKWGRVSQLGHTNFWLSVKFLIVRTQLEQGKSGRVSQFGHEHFWLSVGQPRSVFLVFLRLLWLSRGRAHGQPQFRTLYAALDVMYVFDSAICMDCTVDRA